MFKKYVVLVIMFLLTTTVLQGFNGNAWNLVQAKSKKIAIVELFTAEWCGYCPPANKALDELMDEFGGRVFIPIKQHGQGNGGMNNSYANSRMSRFGIRGFPTTVVDGKEGVNPRDKIAIKQKVTMLNMQTVDTDIFFNGKIENGKVVGEVKYNNAPSGSALHVVLCEAYFYFSGRNGEKVHRMISRDGQIHQISYDGTFKVDMPVPSSMATEMIRLVVFIENDTGIAQSMYWNPFGSEPKPNEAVLSTIPNEMNFDVQREGFSTNFDLVFSNFGNRDASIKVTCKDSYIQVQGAEITMGKESQSKTQVTVQTNVLKPGNYSTQIEISSGNYKKTIPIRFTLVERPELQVSGGDIDFGEVKKGQRARATMSIENKKTGSIKGSITSRARWLEFDPREFDAQKREIIVYANTRDLTAGSHEAEIQINSDGGQARVKAKVFVSASHLEIDKDLFDLGEVTEDKLEEVKFELLISNTGTETASIKIEELPVFISIPDRNYSLEADNELRLHFGILTEKATVNQLNEGNIKISYTDGNLSIPVRLHVKEMPPTLQLTSESVMDRKIAFQVSSGETVSFEVTVENIGKGRLDGKILFKNKHSWIQSSHNQFALLRGQRRTITFSLNANSLKAGDYEEIILIQTNGGNEEIHASMIVIKEPIVIVLQIGSKQATVSGKPVNVDPPPFIKTGTTLVPLRFIIEAFGAEIDWLPQMGKGTIIIRLLEHRIQIEIGNPIAVVNGKNMSLSVPPEIVNGRTFVPLRFISEAFGAKVEWIAETQTIKITYQG